MTLHLIGLFHTITDAKHSHCAFTGKVLRFPKMMRLYNWNVIEYSNGMSESEANEKVQILSEEELKTLTAVQVKESDFVGNTAVIGTKHWFIFDAKLKYELYKRVKPGDIICYPFGPGAHPDLIKLFPKCRHVESGIGYPDPSLNMRIYESYAWMHYHAGKQNHQGQNYHWVVPNYYDLDDWTVNLVPGDYVLYFGRIIPSKGLQEVVEIAKRIKRKVIICGQGDPKPYLSQTTNIEYHPPIQGRERDTLLGNAYCMLMPTSFIEPFGGSGVEGMLCGTPLITTNFGAFTETVKHGKTGFRCNTLGDFLQAIESVSTLSREKVARIARKRFSLETCGKKYDTIFKRIADLDAAGWYNEKSFDAEITNPLM
jgi:glycosyltransferase involved in cell wall biosynthesis